MTAENIVQQVKQELQERKKNVITMQDLIKRNAEEYKKVLPKHMNAERMTRIFVTALSLNPDLEKCTKKSFLGAIFMCAQIGLELNIDGQAYIIPFYNSKKINGEWVKVYEAHFIICYKGYITLFYNSPNSVSINMKEVYENDIFEYEYGTNAHIKHIPASKKNRGEVVYYYAIAKLKNGGELFHVMSKEDCIEHGKEHSKCWTTQIKDPKTGKMVNCDGHFMANTPWAKDLDSMCKKTVLIQLAKVLPKSSEVHAALELDNTTKSIIAPNMLEIRDETNWNDEIKNEEIIDGKVA